LKKQSIRKLFLISCLFLVTSFLTYSEEYSVYKNNKFGIKFDFPKGWEISEIQKVKYNVNFNPDGTIESYDSEMLTKEDSKDKKTPIDIEKNRSDGLLFSSNDALENILFSGYLGVERNIEQLNNEFVYFLNSEFSADIELKDVRVEQKSRYIKITSIQSKLTGEFMGFDVSIYPTFIYKDNMLIKIIFIRYDENPVKASRIEKFENSLEFFSATYSEGEATNPLGKYVDDKVYIEGKERFLVDEGVFEEQVGDANAQRSLLDTAKTALESNFRLVMVLARNNINYGMLYYKGANGEERKIIKGSEELEINGIKYQIEISKDGMNVKDIVNNIAVQIPIRRR